MEQYFWLICGLWCGVGGGFFMWLRLRKHVRLGIFSEEDAKHFSKRMVLWILIPSLILWVLQLSIDSKATPQFLNWPSPQKQIAVGLQIFIHLALIYWVFLKNGANTLSMYFGSAHKTPVSYTHLDVYKRQLHGTVDTRHQPGGASHSWIQHRADGASLTR